MTDRDARSDHPIDTRLKVAALWTATMLIFAYVDLFSLYRPDVRADMEAGRIFAFDIGQPFLFFATLYVIIPALMIYLTLVLRTRVNRIANIVLASRSSVARSASGTTTCSAASSRPHCWPW